MKHTPGYRYEHNLDKPVILRLARFDHREHAYKLQFRTPGLPLFHPWHDVRTYCATHSPAVNPKSRKTVTGKWHIIIFYCADMKCGNEQLNELKTQYRTVRDLFNTFVEPGLELSKHDTEAYRQYAKSVYMPRNFI